jgi:hypothetical protein
MGWVGLFYVGFAQPDDYSNDQTIFANLTFDFLNRFSWIILISLIFWLLLFLLTIFVTLRNVWLVFNNWLVWDALISSLLKQELSSVNCVWYKIENKVSFDVFSCFEVDEVLSATINYWSSIRNFFTRLSINISSHSSSSLFNFWIVERDVIIFMTFVFSLSCSS